MQKTRWRWALYGVAALVSATVCIAADALATLGVNPREANEQLMSAVTTGNLPFGPGVSAFKKLTPAARATSVTDLFAWARTTTSSAVFRNAYAAYRLTQKPERNAPEGSVDEELRRRQAEQLAGFADARKALASVPPDQRRELEETLRQAEAAAKAPQMVEAMRAGIIAGRESEASSFTEATQAWEADYPVDPKPLIAKRLRRLLDETEGVDFEARLVARNGRNVFANSDHEARSGDWKLAFRAGREATTAARAAASAWLKELAP